MSKALIYRLKKMKERIDHYEESDLVRSYIKFITLTEPERLSLKLAWDQYYEDCRKTEAYEVYHGMSKAFRHKDVAGVKSFEGRREKIREEKNWLPTPELRDPIELAMHPAIRNYDNLKHKYEQLLKVENISEDELIFA